MTEPEVPEVHVLQIPEGKDFFDWLAEFYVRNMEPGIQEELLAKWRETRGTTGSGNKPE